jgi:DNA polymerase elongation subunit (family B)
MKTLIVDIETVGEDWDKIDDFTKDTMTRWVRETSKNEQEYEYGMKGIRDGLGLSPLTGSIISIGVMDYQSGRRCVFYQGGNNKEVVQDGVQYKPMNEEAMLVRFWEIAQSFQTFVTFNGYAFDVPYLIIRSAIHGIRPSVNLMQNRYVSYHREVTHIDLQDQLSFYGAMRQKGKGSLHMWARAFGIISSKSRSMNGHEVATMYKQGKYLDIACYNAADLLVTAQLYTKWVQFIKL